jgi:hypothetical protein
MHLSGWLNGSRQTLSSPTATRTATRRLKPPCLKFGWLPTHLFYLIYGAPGGIRTPGLLIRSQPLYPTELQAHLPDLFNFIKATGIRQLRRAFSRKARMSLCLSHLGRFSGHIMPKFEVHSGWVWLPGLCITLTVAVQHLIPPPAGVAE